MSQSAIDFLNPRQFGCTRTPPMGSRLTYRTKARVHEDLTNGVELLRSRKFIVLASIPNSIRSPLSESVLIEILVSTFDIFV